MQIAKPITDTRWSWVTYNSPLWRRDRIKTSEELFFSAIARPKMWPALEKDFVNDSIRTHVRSYNRKPIIPTYNALKDGCAQSYFRSPLVQSIMARNRKLDNSKDTRKSRSLNKLSARHRCIPTPDKFQRQEMEKGFVNDAIITERRRTKYKDIIPPYDARHDRFCKSYFEREDIMKLINRTCSSSFNIGVRSRSFMT